MQVFAEFCQERTGFAGFCLKETAESFGVLQVFVGCVFLGGGIDGEGRGGMKIVPIIDGYLCCITDIICIIGFYTGEFCFGRR